MSTRTTKIEWTDKTWNPITGCTKRSIGCTHCYVAEQPRGCSLIYSIVCHEAYYLSRVERRKRTNRNSINRKKTLIVNRRMQAPKRFFMWSILVILSVLGA